jgi:hypothetical protein
MSVLPGPFFRLSVSSPRLAILPRSRAADKVITLAALGVVNFPRFDLQRRVNPLLFSNRSLAYLSMSLHVDVGSLSSKILEYISESCTNGNALWKNVRARQCPSSLRPTVCSVARRARQGWSRGPITTSTNHHWFNATAMPQVGQSDKHNAALVC